MAYDGYDLTHKERHFAREFLKDFDGPAAAERAGFARRRAPALLKKKGVNAYVERAQKRLDHVAGLDQRAILTEWAKVAFADTRDVLHWHTDEMGRTHLMVRDSEDLTPDQAKLVNEISVDQSGNVKVKLADRQAALDKIARHLGMYQDSVGVEFTGELADILAGAINGGHAIPKPVEAADDDDTGTTIEGEVTRPAPELPAPVEE